MFKSVRLVCIRVSETCVVKIRWLFSSYEFLVVMYFVFFYYIGWFICLGLFLVMYVNWRGFWIVENNSRNLCFFFVLEERGVGICVLE